MVRKGLDRHNRRTIIVRRLAPTAKNRARLVNCMQYYYTSTADYERVPLPCIMGNKTGRESKTRERADRSRRLGL